PLAQSTTGTQPDARYERLRLVSASSLAFGFDGTAGADVDDFVAASVFSSGTSAGSVVGAAGGDGGVGGVGGGSAGSAVTRDSSGSPFASTTPATTPATAIAEPAASAIHDGARFWMAGWVNVLSRNRVVAAAALWEKPAVVGATIIVVAMV